MSRFFSEKYNTLEAYVPGEQPRDMQYIKLNTNESPFAPCKEVIEAAEKEAHNLRLYSDPDAKELLSAASKLFGVEENEVVFGNGSDEILNFLFMAFSDKNHPIAFADVTYGFYSVFAEVNGIPYDVIPLEDDFSIDYRKYCGLGKNIVIANPNAPTGIALPLWQIEEIVKTNPDNVVVIDEAYVDFGGETALPLIKKYDNIAVVQTFSKSRALAGARLGFAFACPEIIKDINTIRYSTNPYNVNRMTIAAGAAAFEQNDYYMNKCNIIIENREYTKKALENMGFSVLESKANFVFAKSDAIDGKELYLKLKKRGILVRHFDKNRIKEYNRITIGTREQMDALVAAVEQILKEV